MILDIQVVELLAREVANLNNSQNTEKEGMTLQDWFDYIVREPATERQFSNGTRDDEHVGMSFQDFCNHPVAINCGLSQAHVCAIRLYTTHAYRFFNNPLRERKKHPLPMTVQFLADGLKRLRQQASEERSQARSLWRGFRNLTIVEDFLKSGGTELAPMSTTTNLAVAADYSCNGQYGAEALIMKIKIPKNGFMKSGACLKWISAFPGEDERLFGPHRCRAKQLIGLIHIFFFSICYPLFDKINVVSSNCIFYSICCTSIY